jgi:hypothetical protein
VELSANAQAVLNLNWKASFELHVVHVVDMVQRQQFRDAAYTYLM